MLPQMQKRQTSPLCPIRKGRLRHDEALLFYRKLVTDLLSLGFEINPYDPCVANKIINGKQMTICWHVDDLFIGHVDPTVVSSFLDWLAQRYDTDNKNSTLYVVIKMTILV